MRGGALWFPRMLQGSGRHDNPLLYGCLYLSEEPVSPVVEQLAGLRGTELGPDDLVRHRLPLALAAVEVGLGTALVDLDEPRVLVEESLRPSAVATRDRSRTQTDAVRLYERHPAAGGLRWWSTFESQWANVTLFDRAADAVRLDDVHALALADDVVSEAARFLGLPLAS